MKLPHLKPLVFAKEVLYVDDKTSKVLCEFEQTPTLGVFIEAAAQSCASFFQEGEFKTGYLANAINIELLEKIEELKYIVNLELVVSFDKLNKYSFTVSNIQNTKDIISGELTVAID